MEAPHRFAAEHPVGELAAWFARRPAAALAVLALLVAASIAGLVGSAPEESLETGPAWEAAQRTRSEFDLDRRGGLLALFGEVALSEASGALAGDELERALRALERDLEALPWIEDLVLPWDLPGAGDLALAAIVARHPAVGEQLVLEGRGLLVPIVFPASGLTTDALPAGADWAPALEDAARASLARAGVGARLEVGVTGTDAIVTAQQRAFEGERLRFMLGGALLGFVLASLAFRNVRATFLAGLPPLLGLFVSAGVARLVGLGSDGFTIIVLPLLVLTIGFTDALHVVMEAARQRAASASAAEAAVAAVREIAWPCALTSLTTAIGFGSMATSGNALIVDFGLSCALATGVTFVAVVLAIPLLARTPLGAALERVGARAERRSNTLDSPASRVRPPRSMAASALRYPRAVALGGALATLGLASVLAVIEVDRRAMVDLAEGSSAAETLRRVDAEFGGAFPIAVRLDWAEGVDERVVLGAARDAAAVLGAEPLVAGPVGPADLVDGLVALGVAEEFAPAALRLVPARFRAPIIDLDDRRALVRARVPDAGGAAVLPAFERIRAQLDAIAPPGVALTLVGEHVAYLEVLQEVTLDLRWSLALAAGLILVTLTAAFRSLRLGLASVVPNLLPIVASVGGLYLVGGRLDVSVLTALTLSLGIATDDTIHVLARWSAERARSPDADPRESATVAVRRAFPALLVTTIALTAAFAQLLTSSIPTIRLFGVVAATTLVVAFVADVWLLPAILVALHRSDPRAESWPERR